MKGIKKIAIYGKGGIGKSTTVSNISVSLARKGLKVMQIGCDPKADSTRSLTKGRSIPTVLETLRQKDLIVLEDLVHQGEEGVWCVESGGPLPGIGCAGRGIITAFEKLEELEAYENLQPDVVLYDVLGDVVCGGFSMPIRGGYADEICIVTSGEMMSLYAAANIAHAVKNLGKKKYASLRGFIQNSKNIKDEDQLVDQAAFEEETRVLYRLKRDPIVQKAEENCRTVAGAYPDSEMAKAYMQLAELMIREKE